MTLRERFLRATPCHRAYAMARVHFCVCLSVANSRFIITIEHITTQSKARRMTHRDSTVYSVSQISIEVTSEFKSV